MDGVFGNLMLGFSVALQPSVLAYAFAGCVIGTLVGMLPGLGPLAGISLLLPATFGLNPIIAIVLLAGVYYGAMYGGSTTSILMRIPGEAASVMTCIDGYAMTQRGRAGPALAIAAIGSFVAGTLSVVALMLLAPTLASFALRFGPPEYTALAADGIFRVVVHERRLDVKDAGDGGGRPPARHDRHRRHERLYAFQLRAHRTLRRHRHRAGRGRALRFVGDPADGGPADAAGDSAADAAPT